MCISVITRCSKESRPLVIFGTTNNVREISVQVRRQLKVCSKSNVSDLHSDRSGLTEGQVGLQTGSRLRPSEKKK